MADVRVGQIILHACNIDLPYCKKKIVNHLLTHAARGELQFNLNFYPFRLAQGKKCETRSKDDANKEISDIPKSRKWSSMCLCITFTGIRLSHTDEKTVADPLYLR